MPFPKHIFKAYDIRGLAESELSNDLAYCLGRAFVIFLKEKNEQLLNKKLVVGFDMRPTSLGFSKEVIRGITEAGVSVVNIGLTSTPLFNFTCVHYPEYAGGIMVTASHNPAQYNGFKITLGNGLPVGLATGMDRIRELVMAGNFIDASTKGTIEIFDPYPDYEKKIFGLVAPETIQPLKIVVDAGNGMAKVSLPKILKKLPLAVEYLFLEPDGTFPNHEANPLKAETLASLQKKVLENKADLGFALDGDADRVGFVDEKGEIMPASLVGALLGLEVLKKHPGSYKLYSLITSRTAKELWEEQGATTNMTSVGHAPIKKQMREENAVFATELSLHMFYRDMYSLEVPELSLLYMLQAMNEKKGKLSELWQDLATKNYHSGEHNFKVKNAQVILQNLKEKYCDAIIQDFDGLLFTYPDYWFNVRLSNTEPLLRLNLEAKTKELMGEKIAEITKIINK